jgi:hypothetical protein
VQVSFEAGGELSSPVVLRLDAATEASVSASIFSRMVAAHRAVIQVALTADFIRKYGLYDVSRRLLKVGPVQWSAL